MCPPAFHEAVRAAVAKWRWFPPEIDGEQIEAQTTIAVEVVPPGGS